MKITSSSREAPPHPQLRKQHMEFVLSRWRRHPYWLRTDGVRTTSTPPDETHLTHNEAQLWQRMLRGATPVAPASNVDGLRVWVAVAGSNIDELVARGAVRIHGPRAAVHRMRRSAEGDPTVGGYSWAIRVAPGDVGVDVDVCKRILNKRFRELSCDGDALLGSEPWSATEDAASFLLADALLVKTSTSLVQMWKLARALHVSTRFVAQLQDAQRALLAHALRDELIAASEHLDVGVDARLEHFTDGRPLDDELFDSLIRPLALPKSRLSDLLAAERFLEHSHHGTGDHYFDDLAEGFALSSEPYKIADVLQTLPPGRALFAAFDAVCAERPELIATFVWHPSLHAAGAFALTELPQQLTGYGPTLDLSDEWEEAQRLGRELLMLGDRSGDWPSLLALGVRDDAPRVSFLACLYWVE